MKLRPKNLRRIARERIEILFNLAQKEKDKKLRDRYAELILKIAQKVRMKLPRKIKRRICKYCHAFLIPGVNLRVRTWKGKVIYHCLECKHYMRFPFLKEKLRILRIKNIEEGIELAKKILGAFGENYPRTEEFVKKTFKKYPEFFLGAYLGKKLVGIVFCYPNFEKKELLIGEICIKKRYRRRGIGKKLIEKIEKIAKKKGIKKIIAAAKEESEGFYRKLGFREFLFVISKGKIRFDEEILEKAWEEGDYYKYILKYKEELKERLSKKDNIISLQSLFVKEL